MNVYPAAGLINYVPGSVPIYVVDPNEVSIPGYTRLHVIRKKAGEGIVDLMNELRKQVN